MKRLLFLCFFAVLALAGCNNVKYAEAGGVIITPKDLRDYIGADKNAVIVDMQSKDGYKAGHVEGAVNITLSSIVINVPVDNMLAPKSKIQTVMSEAGIGNDTLVIVYDDGNSMHAARLWWTLLVYGHDNCVVVSGGLPAITKEGIGLTTVVPVITPATFAAEDLTGQYVVKMGDVLAQVNNPDRDVILLDARSDAEYVSDGKIPGSIMYDYMKNFYKDGMFLDVRATRLNYLDAGLRPEKTIITYCRTSMRSACTFLALYNAGYRNLKMYDGAYLEWSASGQNPVDIPSGVNISVGGRDNS